MATSSSGPKIFQRPVPRSGRARAAERKGRRTLRAGLPSFSRRAPSSWTSRPSEEIPEKIWTKRKLFPWEASKFRDYFQISPIVLEVVKKASVSLSRWPSDRRNARQIAVAILAEAHGKSKNEIKEIIAKVEKKSRLVFTEDQKRTIQAECRQPLRQLKTEVKKPELPPEVEAKIEAEQKEIPKAKTSSFSAQVKRLASPTGWRLANLERHLEQKAPAQIEKISLVPLLASEGIRPEDIRASIESLEKKGLAPETPILETYRQIEIQLQGLRNYYPEITKRLDAFHQAARESGALAQRVPEIIEKFNLPYLKIAEKLPGVEAIGKLGQFVQKIDFGVGAIAAKIGQTALGQAVIGGAKKIGGVVEKVAAEAAVKLAAKAGIELTVTAAGLSIPGVGEVMLVGEAAKWLFNQAEKLPLIGPVITLMKKFSLKNIATLPFRLLKDKEPGKKALGALMLGLPALLALGAGAILFPPVFVPLLIGGGVALGAGLLVTRAGVIVPKITGALGNFAFRGGTGASSFLISLPVITTFSIPLSLVIGVLVLLALTVIFIVVMIAGGAFMVTPHRVPVARLGSSEYIDVRKTVNGQEQITIDNPTDSVELDYQITIDSEGQPLTNIQVSNETRIINPETGATFFINNDIDNNPIASWEYENIPPNQIITYTIRLHPNNIQGLNDLSQIHDSWLIDTVFVNANVPEEGLIGEKEAAQARVKIGDPVSLWPEGWPTTGVITQMPRERPTHIGNIANSIDITNSQGTPIYATHEGIARCLSDNGTGYGRHVELLSSGGWRTIYGHLMEDSCDMVHLQLVAPCQIIGLMGNTGDVISSPGGDGTHLHYELKGTPDTAIGPDILDYVPNGHSVDRGSVVTTSCTGGPLPPIATPTPEIPILPTPVSCSSTYQAICMSEDQCPNPNLPYSDCCVPGNCPTGQCCCVITQQIPLPCSPGECREKEDCPPGCALAKPQCGLPDCPGYTDPICCSTSPACQ